MSQVFACPAHFPPALAFSFTSVLDLPIQLALFIAWFVIVGLGIKARPRLQIPGTGGSRRRRQGWGHPDTDDLRRCPGGHLDYPASLAHHLLRPPGEPRPSIFLLATLIICSLTSLATRHLLGLGGHPQAYRHDGRRPQPGVPTPLVAGAVLSGSASGDKLSPLSDSHRGAGLDVTVHPDQLMGKIKTIVR